MPTIKDVINDTLQMLTATGIGLSFITGEVEPGKGEVPVGLRLEFTVLNCQFAIQLPKQVVVALVDGINKMLPKMQDGPGVAEVVVKDVSRMSGTEQKH